jgi:predicted transcriptional regulator
MNLLDSFKRTTNKLLLGKVNKKKKEVEASLVETQAYNTKRLEQLYREVERLEKKEQELRAETDALIEKAKARIIVDEKPTDPAKALNLYVGLNINKPNK